MDESLFEWDIFKNLENQQKQGGSFEEAVYACTEPQLIMFHDSQGDWLEPYLADTFSRSIFALKTAFDRDLIERERPQVVIEEVGERRLWRVPRR